MESALIVRDDSGLTVQFSEEAERLKLASLEGSAWVMAVENEEQNEEATEAMKGLQSLLNTVEKSRKACKQPVLDYGRLIDSTAKDFVCDLRNELNRVASMAGDYQELQKAKLRAAEAARNEELNEIERRRQEERAQAQSDQELEDIDARSDEESRNIPVVVPKRAAGQVVQDAIEVRVDSVKRLYESHPHCVKLTPLLFEVKELAKTGVKIDGVTITKTVKVGVRVGKEQKAIEV